MAKSTCGKCSQIFTSVVSFDKHRTGSYGDAIYTNSKHNKVIGHTLSTRRCMTVEEMTAKGMVFAHGRWGTGQFDGGWLKRDVCEESA